jgi:hypothetical protein
VKMTRGVVLKLVELLERVVMQERKVGRKMMLAVGQAWSACHSTAVDERLGASIHLQRAQLKALLFEHLAQWPLHPSSSSSISSGSPLLLCFGQLAPPETSCQLEPEMRETTRCNECWLV